MTLRRTTTALLAMAMLFALGWIFASQAGESPGPAPQTVAPTADLSARHASPTVQLVQHLIAPTPRAVATPATMPDGVAVCALSGWVPAGTPEVITTERTNLAEVVAMNERGPLPVAASIFVPPRLRTSPSVGAPLVLASASAGGYALAQF